MNTDLPIIVKPARLVWGIFALLWTAFFFLMLLHVIAAPAEERGWLEYAAIAFLGWASLLFWGECFSSLPRIIIDADGVGGRFEGGRFVGTKRIAWNDIIGARYWIEEDSFFRSPGDRRSKYLHLDVNNEGGKYYRKSKRRSPEAGQIEVSFDTTFSKLSDEEGEAIAAVINKHAKAKPPESTKSPFAAK